MVAKKSTVTVAEKPAGPRYPLTHRVNKNYTVVQSGQPATLEDGTEVLADVLIHTDPEVLKKFILKVASKKNGVGTYASKLLRIQLRTPAPADDAE